MWRGARPTPPNFPLMKILIVEDDAIAGAVLACGLLFLALTRGARA